MGEKILSWFERIVTGENADGFLPAVIVAIILGVIVFPYIDANFLYYNRIEKRIDNLTNLVNLTGVPLEENEMLYEEYLSILEEVKTARENALFGSGKAEDSRTDRMWKFAGGAFLWVIIAVVLLFSKKKGEQRTFKHWDNNHLFCNYLFGIRWNLRTSICLYSHDWIFKSQFYSCSYCRVHRRVVTNGITKIQSKRKLILQRALILLIKARYFYGLLKKLCNIKFNFEVISKHLLVVYRNHLERVSD